MMGTGSPGGTEQMAAVRCDFLGCAAMVAMGVHYKAEGRKVSPSSTAWQGLLTPSPGPPARPAGMGIALQDRSHSASITRCEAVLLVSAHSPCRSMPVEWRISLCHLAADAHYLARLKLK